MSIAEKDLTFDEVKEIRSLLQERGEEASFVRYVRKTKDRKGDKAISDRILVLTRRKIFTLKPGAKVIAREAHLVDLKHLASASSADFNMEFSDCVISGQSTRADELIEKILYSAKDIMPGLPSQKYPFKLSVEPATRIKHPESSSMTACGGWVKTYCAWCDFYDVEPREDLCWDVENLFATGEITDFNLQEFDELTTRDLQAAVTALKFNCYFKSFTARDFKISPEVMVAIGEVLKSNSKLVELNLSGTGASKADFVNLFEAWAQNKTSNIIAIDFSSNTIDDKAAVCLGNVVAQAPHGFTTVDLGNNAMEKKGIQALFNGFKKNMHMTATLTTLILNNNQLGPEGSNALASFLSIPNPLKRLSLVNCSITFDTIMPACVRGCQELAFLDLSQNKIGKKEVPSIVQWIQSTPALQELKLCNTRLPAINLQPILEALSKNAVISDISLDISGNDLGMKGAEYLEPLFKELKNVKSLDISDNDLGDEGIVSLCMGVCRLSNLRVLNISNNFKNRTKLRGKALAGLNFLINPDHGCQLSSVILKATNTKFALKQDLLPFVDVIGNNETVQFLDISGHQCGDKLATALSKTLQVNRTLTHVAFDDNLTTLAGFKAFKVGLSRNFSLVSLPLPFQDMHSILRENSKNSSAINSIIADFNRLLKRNQSPAALAKRGDDTIEAHLVNQMQQEHIERLARTIEKGPAQIASSPSTKEILAIARRNIENHGLLDLMCQDSSCAVEVKTKDSMDNYVQVLGGLCEAEYEKAINEAVAFIRKAYPCIKEKEVEGLRLGLKFAPQQVDGTSVQKLLKDAHGVLSQQAKDAYQAMAATVSSFLFERVAERMEGVIDEIEKSFTEGAKKESKTTPTQPRKQSTVAVSPATASAPRRQNPEPLKRGARPTSIFVGAGQRPNRALSKASGASTDTGAMGMMMVPVMGGRAMGKSAEISAAEQLSEPKPLSHITKDRAKGPVRTRRPPSRRPVAQRQLGEGAGDLTF